MRVNSSLLCSILHKHGKVMNDYEVREKCNSQLKFLFYAKIPAQLAFGCAHKVYAII